MKKSDIFWQTYLNLEKEVIEVSKFIFVTDVKTVNEKGVEKEQPCKTQLETYSPHIADLLVRCCVQIEAVSKELYFELNGEKKRGDSTIKFDTDCLKLLDIKRETHKKKVLVVAPFFNLTKEENLVLRPLKEAHKHQGTYWEKCYQAVKHDRYACLCCGNVKALIHALAALYLLNIYMRKDSWATTYKKIAEHDYSLGSSLFAVMPPKVDQLWYGNQPSQGESPFIVVYEEADYKRIEKMQRAEDEALNNYWLQQPELQEPAFLEILHEAQMGGKRVMYFWELAKYRLINLLPSSLSFAERKELFIKSEAWNCWVNQHNKHLAPEEITEETIETEINEVGVRWGMDIMRRLQKLEWIPIAMDTGVCKVYIPCGDPQ